MRSNICGMIRARQSVVVSIAALTIFVLVPCRGVSAYEFKVLYSSVCCDTYGPLLIDPSGNLFGTTYDGGPNPGNEQGGLVFSLTKNQKGIWKYRQLHFFCPEFHEPCPDGDHPVGNPVSARRNQRWGTVGRGLDRATRLPSASLSGGHARWRPTAHLALPVKTLNARGRHQDAMASTEIQRRTRGVAAAGGNPGTTLFRNAVTAASHLGP